MDWTVVIPTRDRREELLRTLETLAALPEAGRLEVVVADNASADGTAAAVRGFAGRTPGLAVRVIERGDGNPCAGRNEAVAAGSGSLLLFLDDDSTPRPGTLAAAEAAFAEAPGLAAVGGPAFLPGGGQDACALPALSACCGWAVRRSPFEAAAGFDARLEQAAEELDLACRLLCVGGAVGRRPGVVFDHRRVAVARSPRRIRWLDLRNNLFLARRWTRGPRVAAAVDDLRVRYTALLRHGGGTTGDAETAEAQAEGMTREAGGADPLPPRAAEALFGFEAQRAAVARFARERGLTRGTPVALVGFTKHAGITFEAAEAAGLEVVAVEDAAPAFAGCRLRGVPVVPPPRPPRPPALPGGVAARLHTDLNPGRDRGRRPPHTLRLRAAYPIDADPLA